MNILIIEDDEFKLGQVAAFVDEELRDAAVVKRQSFQSGLKEAIEGLPDLILLDMSLPIYDITTTEGGYSMHFFAGRDILREISRHRQHTDVIVVTQFEQFGEGKDRMTIVELKEQLANQFPNNYLATVYYHPAREDWKTQLKLLLSRYSSGSSK